MASTSPKMPIQKIALYTAYPWEHALVDLRVEGPCREAGIEVLRGGNGPDADPESVREADLVLIQRDFPRYTEAYQQVLRQARAARVPVVFDLDDLLLELPPHHPDRAIHYYTEALAPMLHAIVEADAVTASTGLLRDYLREFNPRVWLLPNYLDDRFWQLRAPQEGDSDPLVIGYIGGSTHAPDLEYIAPALQSIAQNHGRAVQLRFWGGAPPEALLELPNADWVELGLPYPEFSEFCRSLACDIFIAPLQANLFNRCKSHVKYLEYSSMGIPGVYSRIDPYESIVDHGANGYLAADLSEWEQHLNTLIDSPALRSTMGRAAQETVRESWLLSENAGRWAQAYAEIKAGYPLEVRDSLNQRTAAKMAQFHIEMQALQQARSAQLQAELEQSQTQARAFQGSTAYKLGSLLAPPGSRRERLVQRAARILRI